MNLKVPLDLWILKPFLLSFMFRNFICVIAILIPDCEIFCSDFY
uniref:Uncharacterized protein n=1 Tax=Octopus bimaculoides TaxID=37653 RepID=A0A0L8H1M3_OCTBM